MPGSVPRQSDPQLELVRSFADDLPVGVWVARAKTGELLYSNRTFAEIMGQEGRADVGIGSYSGPYGIYGVDGAPYPEDRMPFVRAVTARESVVVDDIVIWRRDGKRVPVRAHARPIFDDGGEITHVVIAFFDISKEVEAERASDELAARLRHAERMQSVGQLAAGIAHDFNNVLAAVRVLGSRLRMGETDPMRVDLYEQLDHAAQSGARLAKQLLVLGGSGRSTIAPVILSELAADAVRLLDRTLDGRMTVRFASDGSPCVVRGDASRLEQVLMNLALNARDALQGSGGALTISTRSAELDDTQAARLPPLRSGPHVVLEVRDTGTGIAPEIRDRMFDPYVTTRTQGENRGTGLGLATVYRIVEAHEGAIEVEDVAPHGTTMRVWLPEDRQLAHERAPRPASEPMPRGAGLLLFVDDEDALRRSCGSGLAALGYEVLLAADGREAIDLVKSKIGEICAVLLDLVMPEMDGRDAYFAMRELDPELPVILTTGTPFDPAVPELLRAGVRELMPKPFGLDALARAIAKVRREPAPR
jgi:two-component system cell cycle sensor histidine kinase/response regulator CckA